MIRMQKQKILITIGILFILLSSMFTFYSFFPEKMKKKQYTFQARIMAIQNNLVTVQDKNHTLYTFQIPDLTLPLGGDIAITYTGLLDPTKSLQTNEIMI